MSRILKLAGIVGLTTPILVFVIIFSAIASWPNFSWTKNALSDLGVQWGVTAGLFNIGLVLGGLLFIVFTSGLYIFSKEKAAGKIGSAFFFLSCIALVGIGIFNETFSTAHYIFSLMFFISLPLALFAFVFAFWQLKQRKMSALTIALSLIASSVWLLQFGLNYVPNVAIPETVSGLAGSAWAMTIAYTMLEKSKNTVPAST